MRIRFLFAPSAACWASSGISWEEEIATVRREEGIALQKFISTPATHEHIEAAQDTLPFPIHQSKSKATNKQARKQAEQIEVESASREMVQTIVRARAIISYSECESDSILG